jgi:hypothetical protein
MGTKNRITFGAFALLISDIAMLDAVFMMFGANSHEDTLNLRFSPWVIVTAVAFALYSLFLRKERTLLQAVIFLGVAYIITIVIMLGFLPMQPGIILNLIAMLFFAIPLCRLYFLIEEPPTLDKLISRFGAIIFVLLFVFIFLIGTEGSLIRSIPSIGALILCLVALVIMRTTNSGVDSRSGIRGAVVIFTFVLLIGCVVTLFIFVSFGDVLMAGAIAIWGGITYLLSVIARFFEWLASLLPMREFETIHGGTPMPGTDEAFMTGEIMDFGEAVAIVFLTTFGIVAAIIIVWWTIQMRKRRLGGMRNRKRIVVQKSKISLRWKADRFVDTLKFVIKGILYRNTPQGVFLKLERWGMLRRKGRKSSETPRSYLRRIADNVPEQRNALNKLADSLDAIWYGTCAESTITSKELRLIRRAFI